jgi:serine protease AprX
VVVSAGNDGPSAQQTATLSSLASSENLMAVGATDMKGTLTQIDDVVAPFSSGGVGSRKVDLVAPGSHIISLKAPGAYAEKSFSATGAYEERYFRGSGTSQAAAVVAGAAALVIEQRPSITPTQLRYLLQTAENLPGQKADVQGAGELNLNYVLVTRTPNSRVGASALWSDGLGTIEDARGSSRFVHNDVLLEGEIDIFGADWNSAEMAKLAVNASSWSGGTWNGNEWTASSWSASSWSAIPWSASSWSASSWSASSWSASSWSVSSWSASSWSSAAWE